MSGQLASTFSRLAGVGDRCVRPPSASRAQYSYESDIWAFGAPCGNSRRHLSVHEGGRGRCRAGAAAGGDGSASLLPEEQGQGLLFWDLLYLIVECPPPQLPPDLFSDAFLKTSSTSGMHADGV